MITMVLWSSKKKFFLDHSSENFYLQNSDRDIAVLQQFFIRIRPTFHPMKKKFLYWKQKKIKQRINSQQWFLENFFVLNKTNKKIYSFSKYQRFPTMLMRQSLCFYKITKKYFGFLNSVEIVWTKLIQEKKSIPSK